MSRVSTLMFQEEALPLLQSGLAMKKAALELSLRRYSERLKSFEQRYGMDSQTFAARFAQGELGDEAEH